MERAELENWSYPWEKNGSSSDEDEEAGRIADEELIDGTEALEVVVKGALA